MKLFFKRQLKVTFERVSKVTGLFWLSFKLIVLLLCRHHSAGDTEPFRTSTFIGPCYREALLFSRLASLLLLFVFSFLSQLSEAFRGHRGVPTQLHELANEACVVRATHILYSPPLAVKQL